jgi:hypothetical protein
MNLNNIFKNQKVCLLCCGESLDKHSINYDNYDIVCGVNRIYKTRYFNYINFLFDGCHYIYDPLSVQKIKLLNNSNLNNIVFTCGFMAFDIITNLSNRLNKKHIIKYRDIINNQKISVGTEAFLTIVKSEPGSLEVFGLDFHSSNYIEELLNDYTHKKQQCLKLHNYAAERELCMQTIKESNFFIKLNS